MVKRIFHEGVRRLPVGFYSTQPAILPSPPDKGAAIIKILLFAVCPGCERSSIVGMGSIPQGVFAARKVRDNENHYLTTRSEAKASDKVSARDVFDNKALDQRPLKYNSKLMNSIWGLYNRYSVHNFKKNTDDAIMNGLNAQQCQIDGAAAVVSTEVAVGNGALGPNSTPPVGGALNFYRSLAFILRTI